MNTPERNQIGISRSKFEDSPVFNYLSNLSPIKPVKSAPINQTFNSLNFSSLPSIFTSPHVSSQKESTFLRRHDTPKKSHSECSYTDEISNKENEIYVNVNQLQNQTSDMQKDAGASDSLGGATVDPLILESDPQSELYRNVKYICDSPAADSNECYSTEDVASYTVEELASPTLIYQGTSTSRNAIHRSPSGWESLFSDGMFDSPNIAKDLKALFKSPPVVRVGSSLTSKVPQVNPDLWESDSAFLVDIGEFQNDMHCAETESIGCVHNDYHTMIEGLTNHQGGNGDDEPMTRFHHGLRRRCLVFDANAAHRENLLGASSSNLKICMQSNPKVGSTIRTPLMRKTACKSSVHIISGIGLHLNTLATRGESGVQVSGASCRTSFQTPITAHESVHDVFTGTALENNADSGVTQGSCDANLAPELVSVDDYSQISPRKKRAKPDSPGDESCKRCNCKKSKCLKLYCECFAAGVYCMGTCACQDCHNTPNHEETVLATRKQIESRNPLAFAPKVIRTSDPLPYVKDEDMNTPASARHKRGCNCKKSSCQKKYCECYQGGVGCSINCRCETCKNVFGTKDGSMPVASRHEEEEEIEQVEKRMNKKSSRSIVPQSHIERNSNNYPATPLRLTRMSIQQSFSSKGKPPRSSLFTVGSASGLNTIHKFDKLNHLNPPPKFQRKYSAGHEEIEIPEMLRNNGSPNNIVKTSSPNGKRVSSPQSNFGSSGRRSTRKLILQSIPSFPSLTQP